MGVSEMIKGTDVSEFRKTYRIASKEQAPDELFGLRLSERLRYGENPNQVPAAVYGPKGRSLNIKNMKSGKGGMSATNFMDVSRALNILKYFLRPSVAVMKHCIPSGFATESEYTSSLVETYLNARDADKRSAFGSFVVLNCELDKDTAEAISDSFVEGVVAPSFDSGVMGILERKKDMRVLGYSNLFMLPKFEGDCGVDGIWDMRTLPTGETIVQKPFLTRIKGKDDLIVDPLVKKDDENYVVEREPTSREVEDMLTAWYVNLGVRSNGVVAVKNGVTLAISSGHQERVGAVEQMIFKAYQKDADREGMKDSSSDVLWKGVKNVVYLDTLEGAVVSSDGFFPFRDSIDTLARYGVSAVVQPGGSIRDYEVIEAANENNMAMAFTLERCFGHF
jgi:phosphoribosylaminoimidazolecarboxamide formyltransferase / IMP cyclohydrolase